MYRHQRVFAVLSIAMLGTLLGELPSLRADEPNPVTAIDILLEPDATMIKKAGRQ